MDNRTAHSGYRPVKPFDAVIAVVGHKHVDAVAGPDPGRVVELTVLPPRPSGFPFHSSGPVEHAKRVSFRVQDIHVALEVHVDRRSLDCYRLRLRTRGGDSTQQEDEDTRAQKRSHG